MALAQESSVLLLDEPTTFLDIAHQIEVMELVWELNRRDGRTVIMVLHDLIQACRYADFIVAMKDGRIVTSGAPVDVVTPALVHDVFGVDCDVVTDTANGAPMPLVLSRSAPSAALASK
jgi:iron complex transport system ATP-binding protein